MPINFQFGILTKAIEPRRAYELMGYLCNQMFAHLDVYGFLPCVRIIGKTAHISYTAPEASFEAITKMAESAIKEYEEKYPVEKPA